MAELNTAPTRTGTGPRRKMLSTRVDLTPMVDLGFLLITFFIFTTTMSLPKAMTLNLPSNPTKEPNLAPASSTLNLVLEGKGQLAYYLGADSAHATRLAYSGAGLSRLISSTRSVLPSPDKLIILIHPTPAASYGDLVDMLDEMTINQVKKFVLMEQRNG